MTRIANDSKHAIPFVTGMGREWNTRQINEIGLRAFEGLWFENFVTEESAMRNIAFRFGVKVDYSEVKR